MENDPVLRLEDNANLTKSLTWSYDLMLGTIKSLAPESSILRIYDSSRIGELARGCRLNQRNVGD